MLKSVTEFEKDHVLSINTQIFGVVGWHHRATVHKMYVVHMYIVCIFVCRVGIYSVWSQSQQQRL